MTAPPVPDRPAEIVREAVARLESAGEPVTPEAVAQRATSSINDMMLIVLPWAFAVAATEYLADRERS